MKNSQFFFLLLMSFATLSNAQVTLYKSSNWTGDSKKISDNWVSNGAQDPWNDAVHSIKVDEGWSAILYEHVNNGGDVSETIKGNWQAPEKWNKKISSIAVMRLTDKNGSTFGTGLFGNKIWMTQNLDGSLKIACNIEKTTLDNKSPGVNFYDGKPRFAYYNNDANDKDPATGTKLGALFNFAGIQCPICPEGYRIPTESEWIDLFKTVGGGDAKKGALSLIKRSNNNPAFIYTAGRIDSYGSVKRGDFVQYWTKEGKAVTLDNSGYKIIAIPEQEKRSGFYVRCLKNGQ